MKILRLARARVLLWAQEREDLPPFEVSKVVGHPLQPDCPSAPRCPKEPGGSLFDKPGPAWIDPMEPPHGACAYSFGLRGECLRHRNQLALESALFRPSEIALTRRLLEAMGFVVTEETVDAVEESRILGAHSFIGPDHEVRLLQSPAAGPIVLVRQLANPGRRRERPRLREARHR